MSPPPRLLLIDDEPALARLRMPVLCIAGELDVDDVIAEVLPEDKAHQVQQLRDVAAVVAVPHAHRQVLVHRRADGKALHGLRVHADDGEGPRAVCARGRTRGR